VVFDGGIYTSEDSGVTWTQTSAPIQDWRSIASSYDGLKLAAVVRHGGGGIYTSADSGRTWTPTATLYQSWYAIASSSDGNKLAAPNDIVFDRHGGFYFTDLGKRRKRDRDHGGLYYAQPDGSSIKERAYPMLSPNGVGLSPDEQTLYVADTETARLWAFDLVAPGVIRTAGFPSPHGGRSLATMGELCRFDSLAVEASGNIAVTTMLTGAITVFAPDGRVVRSVAMPDTHPTNICFGGPDMQTAYITLSRKGELVAMPWPEPGLRLNFQD
jgi:gluconolactonase